MGKSDDGLGMLILAAILIFVAMQALDEYTETKSKHDLACGGFIEAVAEVFGDNSCDEAKSYMNLMLVVTICTGIGGIGCISSALKKFNDKT